MQVCLTEFMCFVMNEASEQSAHKNLRMVTPTEVLAAFERLGFHDYVDVLQSYLTMKEQQG